MILSTKAIILKNIKYGDSSLILHTYTEEKGLRNYIINGVRSAKSKIPAAAFQVGNLLDIVAYEKTEQQLNRIKEVNIQTVFKTIPFDIKRGATAQLMMEIVGKCIQEIEPNPILFQFLSDNLQHLDETTAPVKNYFLYFMIHLTNYLGFFPGGVFRQNSYFDLKEGVYILEKSSTYHFIRPELSEKLYQFTLSNFENYPSIEMDRKSRNELFYELEKFYQFHIENLKPFECYRVWQELL